MGSIGARTWRAGSSVGAGRFQNGASVGALQPRGPNSAGVLPPPLRCSRASVGTFINQAGVMETAAANVPRVDWSTGKPELLVEGQVTLTTANMTPNYGGNGGNTISASTDIQPLFSGAEILKCTIDASSVYQIYFPWTSPASPTAGSVWVYLPSGFVGSMFADLYDGTNNYVGDTVNAPGQWVRLKVAAMTGTILNLGINQSGAVNGSFFYCSLPQVEVGLRPTSTIAASTAPTTRAADVIYPCQA